MASLEQIPASGKRKKRSSPRIDMTPMVDLAFLLLTFFVMTTTLMKNHGLEIQQPMADDSGRHREIKAEQVLNIVLGLNDQVYWYMGAPGSKAEQSNFSSSGVRKLLLQKNQQIKDLYVFIKASDKSRYQNMIDMFDEVKITGVANYALVDLAPEDVELIR
ncbi:MAG: biopolymer transporter ExbD [Cyclobacteriaceae bacterium]|nr:MAG: biopolymer transporter ExbD [Cyclobacteriaceae bacterium]